MDNGNKFRAITIEDIDKEFHFDKNYQADTDHLIWEHEAVNDHNYDFNWRWIERDETKSRFVTLEDKNE